MPTWIVHGELDPIVDVGQSRAAAAALEAVSGTVRYVEIAGGGHNVWDAAYASPDLTDWLFAQRRRAA